MKKQRSARIGVMEILGPCALLWLAGCGEPSVSSAAGPAEDTQPAEFIAATGSTTPPSTAPALETNHGDFSAILEQRRLRVLVPYAQPYYFIDEGQPRGITLEMFREYGQFIEQGADLRRGDVTVVYVPCELDQILPWLNAGYGDIAAAGLTVTPEREERASFTRALVEGVEEIIVTSQGVGDLASLDDLAGRTISVTSGSSYVSHLRTLSAQLEARGLQAIDVHVASPTLSTEALLEMLNAGILELMVCDAYKAKLWAQVLPDIRLREGLAVHRGGRLAWAVRRGNPELLAHLNEFVAVSKKGTLLGNILIKRYFNTDKWIENPTDKEGRERIERYAGWIQELCAEYDFDWLRVAAQCYQESGLDPAAVSSSGAIGLMQLLPSTGKDMGCEDLYDPQQNLRAGVRYLDWLRTNFFAQPELSEVDRVDFILAAYNAGPGNVRKWRKQAPARGLDPNRWRGQVEVLARESVGVQPIHYVNNIEKYFVAYTLASDLIEVRKQQLEGE